MLLSHTHTLTAISPLLQKQWISIPICLWNIWSWDKYVRNYCSVKQKFVYVYIRKHMVFRFPATRWHTQSWKLLELMKKSRGYQLYFCQWNMYNLQGCPFLQLFVFLCFVALIVSTHLTSTSCVRALLKFWTEILL